MSNEYDYIIYAMILGFIVFVIGGYIINAREGGWAKSQHKGVRFTADNNWEARITFDGVTRSLGKFETVEDAKKAYDDAFAHNIEILAGEFVR